MEFLNKKDENLMPLKMLILLLIIFFINFRIFAAADDDYHAIANATDTQVEESHHTLSRLLHRRFTKSCSESNGLLISGDHVKFSDFVGINGLIENDCHSKLIKVFVSSKIIIDRDLTEAGNETRMFIIAPNWQISGFRKITLNVKMFLGISKTIIDESNLIISSNGSGFIDLIRLENQSKIVPNGLFTKNDTYNFNTTNFNVISKDKTFIGFYNKNGKQRRKRSADLNDDETSLLINSFKSFLREKFENKFEKDNFYYFYYLLDKHKLVQSYYSTLTLVNEFESLENQFYRLKKHIDFLPFYKSLLRRIDEYSKQPKQKENSKEYKIINSFLYTATLSKIYSLTGMSEPNLIVDVSAYLELISEKFDNLNKKQNELEKEKDQHRKDIERAKQLSEQAESLNKLNKEYKDRFDNKISEANEFIKNEITPAIDKINVIVGDQIVQLEKEVNELQAKVEEEKAKAIERQKEIERKKAKRKVFGFFKIFSKCISFLGPIGKAVGTVISTVTSKIEERTLDKPTSALTSASLPSSINTDLTDLKNTLLTVNEQKIANFHKKLNLISKELESEEGKSIGLSDVISSIRNRLAELEKARNLDASKEITALEDELKYSLKNKKKQLTSKRKRRSVTEKTVKILDTINDIADLSFSIIEFKDKLKSDQAEADEAAKAVKDADAKLKQLEHYETQIYESLIPMIKNMETGLKDVASKLKSKSQVALDVNKWQVQSSLKDSKLTLRKFTEGFEIQDHLVRSIEKLEEAMTTLINIYDRIQNCEEQKHLADYISAISLVFVDKIEIKDPKLKRVYQELEITISSNAVINEYNIAINALKQWLFPFAHLYLEDFSLPSQLIDKEKSIAQHVISNADKQIKDVVSKIKAYKSGIFHHDQYIYKGEFSGDYTSSKPFFTWSNENYKEEIQDLLSGYGISLFADVLSSDKDKEAIKFNLLRFHLKVHNASNQNELDSRLKGFIISATHMGNSYFRFKGNVYVLNSESQVIEYSFENKVNGKPVHQNKVYGKMKSGDLMLSPYAMWKIKLIPSSDIISFHDLAPFKNVAFIELAGRGTYVGKDIQGVNFDDFERYVRT